MRFWPLLVVVATSGQIADLHTREAKQGDAIRVSATGAAESARLGKQTIRLFQQPDGSRLGLMPVAANYKPGNYVLHTLGPKERILANEAVVIRDAKFPVQNVQLSSAVQALQPAPDEMETVRMLRSTVSETRYWSEPFRRPVPGCRVSPFGVGRSHNGKATGNYHGGIDQRGADGTPIHAITGGMVKIVRPFNVHGNLVGIDHGQGLVSMYLHMSGFAAKEGSRIEAGDVIGYVGSTGRSTAPHLHWTVAVNGVSVNPEQWVALEPCGKAKPPSRKKRRQPRQ